VSSRARLHGVKQRRRKRLADNGHGGSHSGDEEAGLEDNTSGTGSRLRLDGASGCANDDLGGGLNRWRRGDLSGGGLNNGSLGGRRLDRSLDRRRVDDTGSRGGGGVDRRRNNNRRRRGDLRSGRGLLVLAVGNVGAALGDGHVAGGGRGEGGGERLLSGRVRSDESSGRKGKDGGEAHLEVWVLVCGMRWNAEDCLKSLVFVATGNVVSEV
jgi:hypothetical protein